MDKQTDKNCKYHYLLYTLIDLSLSALAKRTLRKQIIKQSVLVKLCNQIKKPTRPVKVLLA